MGAGSIFQAGIEEKIIPSAGIIFKNPFLSWVLKIKMVSYFFTLPGQQGAGKKLVLGPNE